jgi:hypothetical protein
VPPKKKPRPKERPAGSAAATERTKTAPRRPPPTGSPRSCAR